MKNPDPYYVIGIGLSTGGLKPLIELFDHLPSDLDAAFLIAGHLLPGYKSELMGILQKHTLMPITWATDQQKMTREHVYILQANEAYSIKTGALSVRKRKKDEINSASNILFKSMATELDGRAISIILSGVDDNGTIGRIQIHRHGGITFARKTVPTASAAMPETTILNGGIMFVHSVTSIADMLLEITKTVSPKIISKRNTGIIKQEKIAG